jgi:hypothetical protein
MSPKMEACLVEGENMSQNAQASIRRRSHRQRNDVWLPGARFHHMRAEEVEVWGAFRGAASRSRAPRGGIQRCLMCRAMPIAYW